MRVAVNLVSPSTVHRSSSRCSLHAAVWAITYQHQPILDGDELFVRIIN